MQYASRSFLVSTLVALSVILGAGEARADEVGSAEWSKFYAAAETVMRGKFVPPEPPTMRRLPENPRASTAADRSVLDGIGGAWFGVDPHVSVVVRDWGEGYRLYGGSMALSDQLRLSRSTRMVVSRVRLGSGRIAPFIQAGVGQWRVDTSMLPAMHYDVEIASQFGWGVEAHLGRSWDLVAENNTTWIMRDTREAGAVAATHIGGVAFFSRYTF